MQQNLSSPVARSTPQKVGGLGPSKSERIIFLKFASSIVPIEHTVSIKHSVAKNSLDEKLDVQFLCTINCFYYLIILFT